MLSAVGKQSLRVNSTVSQIGIGANLVLDTILDCSPDTQLVHASRVCSEPFSEFQT